MFGQKNSFQYLFDCLDQELLTAKLGAHFLNLPTLCQVHEYLSNKRQSIKFENTCVAFRWKLHLDFHWVKY